MDDWLGLVLQSKELHAIHILCSGTGGGGGGGGLFRHLLLKEPYCIAYNTVKKLVCLSH